MNPHSLPPGRPNITDSTSHSADPASVVRKRKRSPEAKAEGKSAVEDDELQAGPSKRGKGLDGTRSTLTHEAAGEVVSSTNKDAGDLARLPSTTYVPDTNSSVAHSGPSFLPLGQEEDVPFTFTTSHSRPSSNISHSSIIPNFDKSAFETSGAAQPPPCATASINFQAGVGELELDDQMVLDHNVRDEHPSPATVGSAGRRESAEELGSANVVGDGGFLHLSGSDNNIYEESASDSDDSFDVAPTASVHLEAKNGPPRRAEMNEEREPLDDVDHVEIQELEDHTAGDEQMVDLSCDADANLLPTPVPGGIDEAGLHQVTQAGSVPNHWANVQRASLDPTATDQADDFSATIGWSSGVDNLYERPAESNHGFSFDRPLNSATHYPLEGFGMESAGWSGNHFSESSTALPSNPTQLTGVEDALDPSSSAQRESGIEDDGEDRPGLEGNGQAASAGVSVVIDTPDVEHGDDVFMTDSDVQAYDGGQDADVEDEGSDVEEDNRDGDDDGDHDRNDDGDDDGDEDEERSGNAMEVDQAPPEIDGDDDGEDDGDEDEERSGNAMEVDQAPPEIHHPAPGVDRTRGRTTVDEVSDDEETPFMQAQRRRRRQQASHPSTHLANESHPERSSDPKGKGKETARSDDFFEQTPPPSIHLDTKYVDVDDDDDEMNGTEPWVQEEVQRLIREELSEEMGRYYANLLDKSNDPKAILLLITAYLGAARSIQADSHAGPSSSKRKRSGSARATRNDTYVSDDDASDGDSLLDPGELQDKRRGRSSTPRPPGQNALAKSVRETIAKLLGSDKLESVTLKAWQLEDWKSTKFPGPSPEKFLLDLDNKRPRSEWNVAACAVFVPYFRSLNNHQTYTVEAVEGAFHAHLVQLKRNLEYERKGKSSQKLARDKTERRKARRIRMLQRRVKIFNKLRLKFPDETLHLQKVVDLLTWEMMSGDETDPRGDQKNRRYLIKDLEWRSIELKDFLAYLSALEVASRFTGTSYGPGMFPVMRVSQPNAFDTEINTAPKGCPTNFYSTMWLESHPKRKDNLETTDSVNMKLPQKLLLDAKRFLHVKQRTDKPRDYDDFA